MRRSLPVGLREGGGQRYQFGVEKTPTKKDRLPKWIYIPWFMFHLYNDWSYNQPYILTDDFAAPLCMNEVLKIYHEWRTKIYDKCL